MSEKPIITKEQAEIIEEMKRTGIPVTWESNGWYVKRDRRLNNFHFKKFIHAICNGYEVEPEFGVGDWVVYKSNFHDDPIIRKVIKINEHIGGATLDRESIVAPFDLIRHATPSEIVAEKERRTDEKLDRIIQDLSTAERDQLYNKLMMMDVGE